MTTPITLEAAVADLEHLRYMLRHVLYVANSIPDGELIAMVRHLRDEKEAAEADVRRLESEIRRMNGVIDD